MQSMVPDIRSRLLEDQDLAPVAWRFLVYANNCERLRRANKRICSVWRESTSQHARDACGCGRRNQCSDAGSHTSKAPCGLGGELERREEQIRGFFRYAAGFA